MSINIAIDGPAGAGKSSVSKVIASELGFIYIDTGALYRTVALNAVNAGVATDNVEGVVRSLKNADITIKYVDNTQRVFLNGNDVSDEIRTEEISIGASNVAKMPDVRAALVDLQRDMAKSKNAIMDGRDIGTTILPDADLKIFLTASVDARAKRRYDEYIKKGETADFGEIKNEIIMRDEQDMNRKISPLKRAEDAVLVDTSDMTFDEVIECIKNKINKIL